MPAEPSSPPDHLNELLRRLADRERVRSEATVQADVRQLLLIGGLGLADHHLDVQLETQVGDRRRIDIEVGFTAVDVDRADLPGSLAPPGDAWAIMPRVSSRSPSVRLPRP